MKKRSEWKKFGDSQVRKAYIMPYILVCVGIIFILNTPFNIDNSRFGFYSGELIKYRIIDGSLHLTVENEWLGVNTIRVDTRTNREKLTPLLPDMNNVRIWTRRNVLRQIEADGVIIIPYSWWHQTRFLFGITIIGGLLIPSVSKSYHKWRKEEELPGFREELMKRYKENTAEEDKEIDSKRDF